MFELYDLLSFTYNNIEEIFFKIQKSSAEKNKTINGKRSLIGLLFVVSVGLCRAYNCKTIL